MTPDQAAIIAFLNANPEAAARYAREAAAQNEERKDTPIESPVRDVDSRSRSPTLGRSSDPVHPQDNVQRGRSTHRHVPTSTRAASYVPGGSSRGDSESPPRQTKRVSVPHHGRPYIPTLPPSTPPAAPRSDDIYNNSSSSRPPRRHSPSPRRSHTPAARSHQAAPRGSSVLSHRNPTPASRRGDSAAPRPSSLAPRPKPTTGNHPSESPEQRRHEREARTPTPRVRSRSVTPPILSPGPWDQPSEPRRHTSPDVADHPPRSEHEEDVNPPPSDNKEDNGEGVNGKHGELTAFPYHDLPYEQIPTSYESREGQRGGRVGPGIGKDKQIEYTPMERLVTRHRKFMYVQTYGSNFGRKHGIHFNIYSVKKAALKYYAIINKPAGQLGRHGCLVHEVTGLRDDYETSKLIQGCVRLATTLFQPVHIVLKKGEKYKWSDYSANARKKIVDHVIGEWPSLQHFRKTNGDNWLVPGIAARIVEKRKAKTNEDHEQYLRRRLAKHGQNEDDEEEEEVLGGGGEEVNQDDYEDDYTANGLVHAAAAARNRHTQPHPANPPRQQAAPANAPQNRPLPNPRPPQPNPQTTSNSSRPAKVQATSTGRQGRKADKVVAREEVRAKEAEERAAEPQAKKGSSSAAVSKGKRKGKARENTPEDDNDGSEEAITRVTKKVKTGPRMHAKVPSCDPSPAPNPVPSKAKGPAKRRKTVVSDQESDLEAQEEIETCPTKKAKGGSKPTTTLRKRTALESQIEDNEESTEREIEEPPAKKAKVNAKVAGASKKRKVVEPEPESEPVETEEVEKAPTKKAKLKPKMRPPPSPSPEPTAPSQPDSSATIDISSDPPAGSSRAPIVVTSSDVPEAANTANIARAAGLRVVGVSKMKVAIPTKAMTLRSRKP